MRVCDGSGALAAGRFCVVRRAAAVRSTVAQIASKAIDREPMRSIMRQLRQLRQRAVLSTSDLFQVVGLLSIHTRHVSGPATALVSGLPVSLSVSLIWPWW